MLHRTAGLGAGAMGALLFACLSKCRIPDESKVENVQALTDAVHEFGF